MLRGYTGALSRSGNSVPTPAPIDAAYAWIADTPLPVVITEADGRVLALNAAFGRLFTTPYCRLTTEPVEDLIIASRNRAAYRAARRHALTEESRLVGGPTSEFIAVRTDGGEFAANLSFARTSEDPSRLITWIRDLTEGQTIVTGKPITLHERTEELAGFGSWDWTPARHRLRWSDNLFRIFGLRPGEITPSEEYVFAHCHPDDRDRVEQAAAELGRRGRRPELRYRYLRSDGTVRHLRSTVVSAANANGPPRR